MAISAGVGIGAAIRQCDPAAISRPRLGGGIRFRCGDQRDRGAGPKAGAGERKQASRPADKHVVS